MAEHTPMPPQERKNIDGSALNQEGQFTITSIDRKQHIIELDVGGCPVTLVCSPQNNSRPYQLVKTILLDMVANSAPQDQKRLDKLYEI